MSDIDVNCEKPKTSIVENFHGKDRLATYIQTALSFSARYCYNRETSASLVVVMALKKCWHLLDDNVRRQILDESSKEALFGKDDWKSLREFDSKQSGGGVQRTATSPVVG